ncbi:MAG TPA: YrhB domain-containing protein [Gallionellaceae bacterium]|nr:YrhB domain-containing protein [Gallionellaceae bacterium]
MLTETEARAICHSELNKPDGSWPNKPEIVITKTQEREHSWVFYYQSRPYIEQGDLAQALFGSGPFVMLKAGGRFALTAAFPQPGQGISAAEVWLVTNGTSGSDAVIGPESADGGPRVNYNCVSCTYATLQRLSGLDPAAVATQKGIGRYDGLGPFAAMGFFLTTSPPAVVEEMLRAGHGAARPLIIELPENILHVITVTNKNGTVHFLDLQTEKIVTLKPDTPVRLARPVH